jgi:hypothetical protein
MFTELLLNVHQMLLACFQFQLRAYQRVLSQPDLQFLVNAQNPCDCGSGEAQAR